MTYKFTLYTNPYNEESLIAIFPDIPFWFVFRKDVHVRDLNAIIERLFESLYITQDMSQGLSSLLGRKAVTIVVETTRECNLRCRHCYLNAGAPRVSELKLNEFKSVFSSMREYYRDSHIIVWLMGGEPFLRFDILQIIESALYYNFEVGIVTNGTISDVETLSTISKLGVTVSISIDGQRRAHDWLRGEGSFAKAIHFLDQAIALGIDVEVNYVLHMGNVNDLIHIAKLLYDKQVKRLSVNDLVLVGRSVHTKDTPRPLPYMKYFQTIFELAEQFPYFLDLIKDSHFARLVASVVLGLRREPIVFNASNIYIASDGSVFPGNYWAELPDMILGNIRQSPLSKIIEEANERFSAISLESSCLQCDVRYFCAGGRLAETFANLHLKPEVNHIPKHPRCQDLHQGLIALLGMVPAYPKVVNEFVAAFLRGGKYV